MARRPAASNPAAAQEALNAVREKTAATEQTAEQTAEQSAAATEAAARQAELKEKADNLRGKLQDQLDVLAQSDTNSAIEARLLWVNIGGLLREGRELFMVPGKNTYDFKAFGKWIEENNFTALGQRALRSAALWLADVHDMKPDLYALFPTESVSGEPLRRSPRTLQAWVRDNIYDAFQDAHEADAGMPVASKAEKDSQPGVAKQAMTNVYAALAEQMASAAHVLEKAQADLSKAKKEADRRKAFPAFNDAAARVADLERRKAIMEQHTTEELADFFVGWKPRAKSVAFKDVSPDEAADRLFALLKTHPEMAAVYDGLGDRMQELLDQLNADKGAVDESGLSDPDADADPSDVSEDADMDADMDMDEDGYDDDLTDADLASMVGDEDEQGEGDGA